MVPALVELHLHLDGSLNLPWAYEVAKREGSLKPEETFEDFYHILYRTDYKSREDGFRKYAVTCDCMQTPKDLHDSIFYMARELNELGRLYAEVRFAPQQHCLKGLTQDQVVAAVIEGVKDAAKAYPDTKIKLILCMMHKGDSAQFNDSENRETIDVAEKYLGDVVVGIDLAGYENNCEFADYGYLFQIAHEKNIPFTVHAAEMGVGSHILDALEWKATRVGHGIGCVENPEWLQKVIDAGVTLEVCVTSNCNHGLPYCDHPIRDLINAGVKVTLNSDNMMFSKTSQEHEFLLVNRIGVTDDQLIQTTYNAIEAAFCSDVEKAELRQKAFEIYGK